MLGRVFSSSGRMKAGNRMQQTFSHSCANNPFSLALRGNGLSYARINSPMPVVSVPSFFMETSPNCVEIGKPVGFRR